MCKVNNQNLLDKFGLTESDLASLCAVGMTEDEIAQILLESATCSSHTRMGVNKNRKDAPKMVRDDATAYVYGRYNDGF